MNLLNKFEKLSERNKMYIISIWIFILIVLYVIKFFAFDKVENKENSNDTYNLYNDELYMIDNNEDEEDDGFVNPVETFCKYCENDEYEEAYNMLSNNNKQTRFLSLEDFEKYIKSIFVEDSIYNVKTEDFLQLKFTIEVYDNILSTGKWEKNNLKEINTQIVTEDNQEKVEIL